MRKKNVEVFFLIIHANICEERKYKYNKIIINFINYKILIKFYKIIIKVR